MKFELKRNSKKSVFGDLSFNSNSKHLVILVHGFKGFYNWGFFPEIQKRFLSHGCAVLAFNFSMNGVERFGDEITNFSAFAENNFSTEQSDFDDIISYVKSEQFPVKYKNIYGLGHSRGGGALLLASANHPDIFTKIVTWASISKIHDRINENELSAYKKCGFSEVVNGRTGDVLRVKYQFQEDLDQNYGMHDILQRVNSLSSPTCIIHGDCDETVPVSEANELYEHLNKSNENKLFIIKSATHTFNFDRNGNRLPFQLNEAIIQSLSFLNLLDVSQ